MAACWWLILVTLAVVDGTSETPVRVGQTFVAGSLNPTEGSTAWALVSHGIAEKLFTVDKSGDIVPHLAESVTKKSNGKWEVTLKTGKKFSDGTDVTATHCVNSLRTLNRESSDAQASLGTMTMEELSSTKFTIESERPTPIMDSVLAEWIFVVFLEKDSEFLFTGPFVANTFNAGTRIDLVPNTHYHNAAERPAITLKKYNNGPALTAALKAGELDLAFHLPVDDLAELRNEDGISIKSFEVGYHYMMFHNTKSGPLTELQVRQAVDLAINRQALAQELRGGRGTRSLFPDYTPFFQEDETTTTADRDRAKELLDSAGWILSGDKRMRSGEELTIRLVAYPQRPGLVSMQPLIAASLEAVGIRVSQVVTSGSSWDELDSIMADRTFDLLMWAQNTLPAGDPQWFLNDFFLGDGGSNHAGLESETIDSLLDSLHAATTKSERVSATAAVHNQILAEVPVSNLVTPEWHVGLSDRLKTYEPWGSDYYVIRADFDDTETEESKDEEQETGSALLLASASWPAFAHIVVYLAFT